MDRPSHRAIRIAVADQPGGRPLGAFSRPRRYYETIGRGSIQAASAFLSGGSEDGAARSPLADRGANEFGAQFRQA